MTGDYILLVPSIELSESELLEHSTSFHFALLKARADLGLKFGRKQVFV